MPKERYFCQKKDCKLVDHKGWSTAANRNTHERFCPDGKTCPLDPPCDVIFMNRSSFSKHVHYDCVICGKRITCQEKVPNHKALHPAWGQKFSKSLEELIAENPAATVKSQNVHNSYLGTVKTPNENEKKGAPYLIMHPPEVIPPTFGEFVDLIAYPGKSSIGNIGAIVPQERYANYNKGTAGSELMHEFFNSYANSTSKPIFFAPTDFLTPTDAADQEKLMIYVLGTQNLINVDYGDRLSSGFDDWSEKSKSRLGSYLLFKAYEKFKTMPLNSHPRINYCRLNDSKWLKKQAEEKAAKETSVSTEALQQMINLGVGNFKAFAIDGKLVIEPVVKPEAELQEAPHISSGDAQPSRKRKHDQQSVNEDTEVIVIDD